MWPYIATCLTLVVMATKQPEHERLFQQDQIIFSSDLNITSIIVPADSNKYLMQEPAHIPSVFFTVTDPKSEGGSCIYVLQEFAAYEILEGGRDTTSDFSSDPSIYFGARNGIYKYCPESLSAKKFGPFRDDIIQIQKANGTDSIYILTNENKMFKIGRNGTVKERLKSVPCATQFVLDTSNNLYYISCGENLPHIIGADGTILSLTANLIEEFKEIKLLRPAFLMDKYIPFIADRELYMLYSNGTIEKKNFFLKERPSAISVDAAVYLIAALNGKIYEFNVMEILLKSMFSLAGRVGEFTKIVMQVIEKTRDDFHGYRFTL